MASINCLSGWMFDRVIELDSAAPGMAGFLFRCSNERRQAVAAYLSQERPHRVFSDHAALGHFLINTGRDRAIALVMATIIGRMGR